MRYISLEPNELPIGQKALKLFVRDGALSAAVLEHRPDGRLIEAAVAPPGENGVLPTIMNLLGPGADQLYVVLDHGAYWPDSFPPILPWRRAVRQSSGLAKY